MFPKNHLQTFHFESCNVQLEHYKNKKLANLPPPNKKILSSSLQLQLAEKKKIQIHLPTWTWFFSNPTGFFEAVSPGGYCTPQKIKPEHVHKIPSKLPPSYNPPPPSHISSSPKNWVETFQEISFSPGTPNNQFKMDDWWFPTISYVKIWNHPIETTIYKWLFGVPGRTVPEQTPKKPEYLIALQQQPTWSGVRWDSVPWKMLMEYWLVNRDPYNGFWNNPYITG